jgi:P27 family predicted phage terminase small subunit
VVISPIWLQIEYTMPPGRRPKPTSQRILEGNPGKRPINKNEPQFFGVPSCPKHLNKGAKAEWKRISVELTGSGLLTNNDRAALAAYCAAYSRWAEAEENIATDGMVIMVGKSEKTGKPGYPIQNPYVGIANTALDQMRKWSVEFGFTPSARSRIHVDHSGGGNGGNGGNEERWTSPKTPMTTPKPTSFSNRAHQYARNVVAGKVIASKWIKMAAQRHLDGLNDSDSRWIFDKVRANKVCAFASTYRHEKGVLQGQRLILQDWQVFIFASIFGWVDEDGIRKYREALLMIPRGQGKSPLAAIIAIWMAFLDGEPGSECYTAATTEKQALEVFRPARAFIEQEPSFAKLGIVAAAKSIFRRSTRSRFTPVIGRSKYGGAPYCAIMDEAHQFTDTDLYDSFKTGCNKRQNSLLLTISTAGVSSTENPCYQLQQDGQKVLEGIIPNERLLVIIHAADDTVEWSSRAAVIMSNPNLGISCVTEALFLDLDEAIRNPAKQNVFRAMHLNQWSTSASAWMNISAWGKCADPLLTLESVKDLPCWLGLDTASKLDLSSGVKLFRRDIDGKTHYYAFTRNYLPETQVNLPENQHYFKWSKQARLTATDGSAIDFDRLEADMIEDVGAYQVQAICFDHSHGGYGAVQRVEVATGVTTVETPQKPMLVSSALKELEAVVADGRFHFDGDPVLTWCISNIQTKESNYGFYRMPEKQRPEHKIDTAMAMFFALSQAMLYVPTPIASFTPFFL